VVIEKITPGSRAEQRGLLPGDVIWRLDVSDVPDIGSYRTYVRRLASRNNVLLLVQRGRARAQLAMTLS
jgi:S1-C subfamily serine protease